jgi:predicted O-linked N-acetylglucosamine transferase (SPINDLY family)
MPEMTLLQAFDLAVQHHQAGRLNEAESIYRQILAAEPRHADTLHHLGLIAHQVGKNEIAVDMIRQALVLNPDDPAAHSNLGKALIDMGQLDEAITACRQAIALQPDFPAAHYNLGIALHKKGQFDEAIAAYRRAISLQHDYPEAHYNLGSALKGKGQMEDAIAAYQQAIALQPDYADAYNNLGNVLKDKGDLEEAIAAYRRAIPLKSGNPSIHYNLGIVLCEMGQLDGAIAAYRQAIALQYAYPEAHYNLGIALIGKGRMEEAIAAYREAIAIQPDYPAAHNNLGNVLKDIGELDDAIVAYRRAISLQHDCPEAYNNLGNALKDKFQLDEALAAYRKALALRPDYHEAQNNLGNALYGAGQLDEALAAYRQALALMPDLPEAHSNLGNVLKDMGQFDQAIAAYGRAIAIKSDFPEAHNNLGNVLRDKGQLDEAIDAYRQAIALRPSFFQAYSNLGNALNEKGQPDEAIAALRQAIILRPDHTTGHSNLVFCMNYHPSLEASSIAEEHRRWNRQHAGPLRSFIEPHTNERSPDRRLRIGYVSPDFRCHSVAFFFEGLLEDHDRSQVEAFCYAEVIKPDAVTVRMGQSADHWRKIIGLADAELADLIRADSIDILVDLAGHTANNRLPVFARKPAPVQVTWLGYPNTTGLDTIDYRLTDALADPVGSGEELYTEQLVRLPRSGWCYRPFGQSPPVGAPPVHDTGYITYGCFNAMPKINDPLLELWAKILLAVPGSRLLLKNSALAEPSVRQRISAMLGQAGIGPERLQVLGRVPDIAAHLACYGRVDIALDTFPYHGTTTTCEALWMGVPVVTLAGQTHVSRVGVSLLSNLGLTELIAASSEEYVNLAVYLAKDLPRLAHLRSTLRERMERSPLMDASGFAREIEAAFREMWRTWCDPVESQPCPE